MNLKDRRVMASPKGDKIIYWETSEDGEYMDRVWVGVDDDGVVRKYIESDNMMGAVHECRELLQMGWYSVIL